MARSSHYALILGEMQCIAFHLMLSLCVCVCVYIPRLWTPGKQALNSDSKFKFGILFSTCSNSNGVKQCKPVLYYTHSHHCLVINPRVKRIIITQPFNKTFISLLSYYFFYPKYILKETVLESLAKFQRHRSNWSFSLDLHTLKYEPLGGSSYIPLPTFLAVKKEIINLKNEDDEYFKWAITRALNPVEIILNVLIENFEKHQRSLIEGD